MWYTYILKCSDNTLYTWITTDYNRRLDEHNNSLKWAKYTRYRRPVQLVYIEECLDRVDASKREWYIKQLSKIQKEKLILNKKDS
jgi:putative endonuclease